MDTIVSLCRHQHCCEIANSVENNASVGDSKNATVTDCFSTTPNNLSSSTSIVNDKAGFNCFSNKPKNVGVGGWIWLSGAAVNHENRRETGQQMSNPAKSKLITNLLLIGSHARVLNSIHILKVYVGFGGHGAGEATSDSRMSQGPYS